MYVTARLKKTGMVGPKPKKGQSQKIFKREASFSIYPKKLS